MKNSKYVFLVSVIQEGQAIIDSLQLIKIANHPYQVYGNEREHCLIITGIGPQKTQQVMNDILDPQKELFSQPSKIKWINIGIAGHQIYPVGSFFEITQFSFNQRSYVIESPPRSPPIFPEASLQTHEDFVIDYPTDFIVDMEGFIIAESLNNKGYLSHLRVFKLISDNQHQSLLKDHQSKTVLAHTLKTHVLTLIRQLQIN